MSFSVKHIFFSFVSLCLHFGRYIPAGVSIFLYSRTTFHRCVGDGRSCVNVVWLLPLASLWFHFEKFPLVFFLLLCLSRLSALKIYRYVFFSFYRLLECYRCWSCDISLPSDLSTQASQYYSSPTRKRPSLLRVLSVWRLFLLTIPVASTLRSSLAAAALTPVSAGAPKTRAKNPVS